VPELQGRLPIRVELEALSPSDFERILTEPHFSLTQQYQSLLDAEGLKVEFTPDCVKKLAEVAWQVNERTENIGARRLHTVLEKLLEDISFNASDLAAERHGEVLHITADDVQTHLGKLVQDEDLSRFIL
jgi:ATP-dependent HslUV protease ATP-binding subunit HslU